jgi:hypothetical protein
LITISWSSSSFLAVMLNIFDSANHGRLNSPEFAEIN